MLYVACLSMYMFLFRIIDSSVDPDIENEQQAQPNETLNKDGKL